MGGHLVAQVPDHDDRLLGVEGFGGRQHMAEQCPSGKAVHNFRGVRRLHPGTLARGNDDDRDGTRVAHAGGLGLEPRLSGTKDRRAANYPIPHSAFSLEPGRGQAEREVDRITGDSLRARDSYGPVTYGTVRTAPIVGTQWHREALHGQVDQQIP